MELGLVKDGIYKRIEYAIENVLDICAMVHADLSLGVPESEDDIITTLEKNRIIKAAMSDEIRQLKRFRNLLCISMEKLMIQYLLKF